MGLSHESIFLGSRLRRAEFFCGHGETSGAEARASEQLKKRVAPQMREIFLRQSRQPVGSGQVDPPLH